MPERLIPNFSIFVYASGGVLDLDQQDGVIPAANAGRLLALIPNAQLHIFGRCGHWTQIEHAQRFNRLVGDFLAKK